MSIVEELMNALSGMKGGTHPWLMQALHGAIGDQVHPGPGLHGVLDKLEKAGLGPVVQSWQHEGRNLPLDPKDLHRALGDAEINAMAFRAKLTPDELIGKLSQHLPGVVELLSREGKLNVSPTAQTGSGSAH
jgi:uncharacterized protein YidB (DUF937 family)